MQFRWFTLVLLALVAQTAAGLELREHVEGDRLKCQSFLKLPDDGITRGLIFYVQGTGIEPSSEPLHPLAKYWFHKKQMAVLTVEKPGIEKKNSRWKFDIHEYQEHTPDDLLVCAINSLLGAATKLPDLHQIFFVGHGAGGEVLLRAYLDISNNVPELAKKVKLIQLTSPNLGGWRELADFQLKTKEAKAEFQNALDNENVDYFQKHGRIPFAFWRAALKLPPAGDLVKELATKAVAVHIYQGRRDEQVCSQTLEKLEAWSKETEARKKQMKIHWYTTSQSLDEAQDSVIPQMIEDAGTAF